MPGTHVTVKEIDPLDDRSVILHGVISKTEVYTVPYYYDVQIHESEYDKQEIILQPFFDNDGYTEVKFSEKNVEVDKKYYRNEKLEKILK